MSGLSAAGFLSKRLPQIKAELEAEFRAQFGADLNVAPETVVGQLIGIESEAKSLFWASLDDVYQSQYPATASGASLDLLVAINGLTRLPELPTTVTGYLSLTVETVVAAGRKAKDNEITYTLLDTVTGSAATAHGGTVTVGVVANATLYSIIIDGAAYSHTSSGSATASTILTGLQSALPAGVGSDLSASSLTITYSGPTSLAVTANLTLASVQNAGEFSADATGPQSLPIGALNAIETPVAGWLAVTNRAAGTLGRDIETDGELRVRRSESTRLQAVSTMDGITSQLLRTADVLDAVVIENSGTVTDINGIPPQHIWCIVDGGAGEDIASVIYRRKAAGIGTFGDVSSIAYSAINNAPYTMNFSRPVVTPVYITVNISASASIPSAYIALVRAALVAYGETLDIGENLILNRLFTPASLAIDDLSFVSGIRLGLAPSPTGTANLLADADERFQINAESIDVLLD